MQTTVINLVDFVVFRGRKGRGGKTRVFPDPASDHENDDAGGQHERRRKGKQPLTETRQQAANMPALKTAAKSGAAADVDQDKLLEAAARFSHAVSELQFLGVWRPLKRRQKAAAVQKTFIPLVVDDVEY
eukprot:jgi/Chrzof1/8453/Cz03g11050.t1